MMYSHHDYGNDQIYRFDKPIYVNGVDINTGIYPVLQYQFRNTQHPFIYVPISAFGWVGAKVNYSSPYFIHSHPCLKYIPMMNNIASQKVSEISVQLCMIMKSIL